MCPGILLARTIRSLMLESSLVPCVLRQSVDPQPVPTKFGHRRIFSNKRADKAITEDLSTSAHQFRFHKNPHFLTFSNCYGHKFDINIHIDTGIDVDTNRLPRLKTHWFDSETPNHVVHFCARAGQGCFDQKTRRPSSTRKPSDPLRGCAALPQIPQG